MKNKTLAQYLDDMMTTANTGVAGTSNYIGTMRKFNRRTGKAKHVMGGGVPMVTKNAKGEDIDPKTGKVIRKKKEGDPQIPMKGQTVVDILKKNKERLKGGLFGIQDRTVIL